MLVINISGENKGTPASYKVQKQIIIISIFYYKYQNSREWREEITTCSCKKVDKKGI